MGGTNQARSDEPAPVARYAWAKVNLYLHILGRRPDGYHELDSLISFAGVGDRLSIATADELVLTAAGPFAEGLPMGEENLVLRAARRLAEACQVTRGAHIHLEKCLPVAAGIGGGSADAAAVLEGLAEFWGVSLEADAFAGIALALGADVPVCLSGQPTFVGGIGEDLERAPPLPQAWLVLANPGKALLTAEVFKARQGAFSEPARWVEASPTAEDLAERLAGCRNDLEPSARDLLPEVSDLLDLLSQAPACLLARLSGSGPTGFGLFASRDEARQAAAAIAKARPSWWVAEAPLLHGKLDRPWWDLDLPGP